MASQLANLLLSTAATVAKAPKTSQPVPTRSAPDTDRFARLVDNKPSETRPAIAANGPGERTRIPTESDPAAKADEVALQSEDGEEGTGEAATQSLADTLLSALAALGLTTEALPTDPDAPLDLAALGDIEAALTELSELLGMDVATLMQQLADLAGGAGGETDFATKLSAWLGERLGPGQMDAKGEMALNKLLAGLNDFARGIPTEPQLGMAQLDLPEPVLAKPAAATTEKTAEPDDAKVAETALKTDAAKPADAPAPQAKSQQPAAAQAEAPDNQLNLSQVAPKAETAAQQLETPSAPRVIQSGYQTSQQQLNLPQIAFEVSRQVQDGNSRFQIRLDPPELGRIDVKLDIDATGRVTARLTVEKAETLDLMQRDQRALERALQQAGLDQSKTNLEFSLKQNPFAGQQDQHADGEQAGMGGGQNGPEETEVPAPAVTLYRGSLQASGVNIIA